MFGVWGLGLGFRVWELGFGVEGLEVRVQVVHNEWLSKNQVPFCMGGSLAQTRGLLSV